MLLVNGVRRQLSPFPEFLVVGRLGLCEIDVGKSVEELVWELGWSSGLLIGGFRVKAGRFKFKSGWLFPFVFEVDIWLSFGPISFL